MQFKYDDALDSKWKRTRYKNLMKKWFEEQVNESVSDNKSLLMATLNSEQKVTRDVLLGLGWVSSDWALRPRFGEDRPRVCILHYFTGEREV